MREQIPNKPPKNISKKVQVVSTSISAPIPLPYHLLPKIQLSTICRIDTPFQLEGQNMLCIKASCCRSAVLTLNKAKKNIVLHVFCCKTMPVESSRDWRAQKFRSWDCVILCRLLWLSVILCRLSVSLQHSIAGFHHQNGDQSPTRIRRAELQKVAKYSCDWFCLGCALCNLF